MAVGRSPEETGDGTSRAGRGSAVRGGARSRFVLRVEVVPSSGVSGWRTVIMSREHAANLLPGGHRRSCGPVLCVADQATQIKGCLSLEFFLQRDTISWPF